MSRPEISLNDFIDTLKRQSSAVRSITAVAGPPGAGKSTTTARIVAELNRDNPQSAAVLPMDGYHFDDIVLEQRGLKSRKGSPATFDVAGLDNMLLRLKRNVEDEIAIPVFDRDIEVSRAGARLISRSVRHLIVEGNYLLLASEPWSKLHALFDLTAMLVVPVETLRQRLISRWQAYGLTPEEIDRKVEGNDLPNARLVLENSVAADIYIRSAS